jgi:novobiocin biosynthesis protein NovU/D-mycarose 3-C-methyltransferase
MIDFGELPLAGGFLDGPEAVAKERRYPLAVHVCRNCALVQIVEPVDPDVLFQDYSFSASTIPGLVRHFEDYARWLVERHRPELVVEFGCNDGVLLAPLEQLGVRAVGVDISGNITELARERGHTAITGAFTPEVAERIREEHGQADVVTGSNVFAHNADPETILDAARTVLKPDGVLALEFMYAGDLYEQVQWDTLYHEHLTFYSLATVSTLLERHGFAPVHAERIPMHGGSLRLVASLDAAAEPDETIAELLAWEERTGIGSPELWTAFADDARRTITVVTDVLDRLRQSARIWGYGAAGKATMWVNLCGLDYLEAVVDASPLRAGKLMPGTHTPIVLPGEFQRSDPPEFVFVTAWNYLDAIRANEDWYPGTWITPLPRLAFT